MISLNDPKRRRLSSPESESSSSELPFSYLPPDVVVSHVLPHVVVRIVSERKPRFASGFFMRYFIEIDCRVALHGDAPPNGSIFCFGRFVRDFLRHPWFVFRSFHATERIDVCMMRLAVDTKKIICISADAVVPVNPSLETFSSDRSAVALATPNRFPSLTSCRIPYRPGIFDELAQTHPSNLQNLRTLNLSGNPLQGVSVDIKSIDSFLSLVPHPHNLTHLELCHPSLILSTFVNLVSLSMMLATSDRTPSVPMFCVFPSLRSLSIVSSFLRMRDENAIEASRIATWCCPVLQRLSWSREAGVALVVGAWIDTLCETLEFFRVEMMSVQPVPAAFPTLDVEWKRLRRITTSGPMDVIDPFFASSSFPRLAEVDVMGDDTPFPELTFPSLEKLHVRRLDSGFLSASNSETLRNLQELRFSELVAATDEIEFGALPSLNRFGCDLSIPNSATQRCAEYVATRVPHLKHLHLSAIESGGNVIAFPEFSFASLVSVHLSHLETVSSSQFSEPVFQNLLELKLHHLGASFGDDFFQVKNRFPVLRILVMSRCPGLTGENWSEIVRLILFKFDDCRNLRPDSLFKSPPTTLFPSLLGLRVTSIGYHDFDNESSWKLPEGCKVETRVGI